jgi:hypothetical protein
MRPQCGGSLIGGSVMIQGTRTQAAIATALLCFSPLLARADAAADARLAAMEQRMTQLEDKLATSEQTIADQAELLKTQATPGVAAGGAVEKIDRFLSRVDVSGYVSASYVYNANNPSNPIYANALNQFNLNHNQFNLDAAEIDFSMPAAEPGQAGFDLDINFGNNAEILGGYGPAAQTDPASGDVLSDNQIEIEQMNVSYNWNDIVFKAGKFDTLLGYEVLDIVSNKQVTQGVLFTYAIPLYHTGLLASSKFNEEWGWALGVVNGWGNANSGATDTNDNKGALAQINLSTGPFSTALSTYYGSDGNTGFANVDNSTAHFNESPALVVDWTATVKPTDALAFWWEANWSYQKEVQFDPAGSSPFAGRELNAHWYGGLLGASFQVTDAVWVSARGEIMRDSKGYRITNGDEVTAYTLTGTLGYKLTDNLLARLEVRYDDLDADSNSDVDSFFPQGGANNGSSRDLQYIANVAYVFD